jgi:murein DD-endopeptidase MepM/ murein hydrolase activator NlpD
LLFRIVVALLLALLAPAPALGAQAMEPGTVPPPAPPVEVFPVPGPIDYGSAAAHFGGARDHKGQDVFADCGTPVHAVRAGRVREAKYEGAAGNYAVITTDEGRSHVYMHLRAPARVRIGERVLAGQRLGSVGESGDAWDCHLHLEVWTAPGWFAGGHPVDPLPYLRSLR